MRSLILGRTGLTTTALGYGCAGIMRPIAEKDRFALLATAFDAGIRHFDVARYYGHGGAEAVLGKFLANIGRRDQVTITTKFGIEPSVFGGTAPGKTLMRFARRVASYHPGVHRLFSRAANRTVQTGCFDEASARRSLETSLRELATDRVDLFLLHEATLEDTRTDGLLEFLEGAKLEGKIRAFGIGTDFVRAPEIIIKAPAFARVVQAANGFGHWDMERLPHDPERVTLTHGALKALPTLERILASDSLQANVAEGWQRLGSPQGPALAGLLLGLSLHGNPGGITLFSSIRPERIRENVSLALRHNDLSPGDWMNFRQTIEMALRTIVDVH